MIDSEVLHAFMREFAGYGNPAAPVWFVGMEEGSGQGLEELRRRLQAWSDRGRLPLEDLPAYHHAIGLPRHFISPWPLQRTWAPLLRCLLAWRGASAALPDLRRVQAMELGTPLGDTALVELLPLPSPGLAQWPYGDLAPIDPALRDRSSYRATYTAPRTQYLRTLLSRSGAQAVLCYGLGYLEAFEAVADVSLQERRTQGQRWFAGETGGRRVVVAPHPVARGAPPDFWASLGEYLRTGAG